MTETANLGMPFIEGSQAQKHITHNEALRILDAAIQIGVLDTAMTAPPSSPVEGARYIVASGASGDWTDHDNAIAAFEDGAWRFLMPKLGWCAWSAADEVIFVFDGAAWRDLRDLPLALDSAASVGVNTAATSPNLLTVRSNAALFYAIAAVDGGSGDARLQISKESSANTASVVFSDNFSGRAEFGLVESDAFKLKVSNDGASFVEALAIDQATGNATLPRGVALTGIVAPPQLTADEDDYAPSDLATASVLRISADAVRSITGLAGGAEGRVLCVINAGAFAIVLRDDDTASSAANRFGFGGDLTLDPQQGALLMYDGSAARWRQLGAPLFAAGIGTADSDRQNTYLALIDQAKMQAGYRRRIDLFADGYTASDGIDAGASSGYQIDTGAGKISPAAGYSEQTAAVTGSSASANGYTFFDRSFAIDNGVTIARIGVYSTAAGSFNAKIALEVSSTSFDIVVSDGPFAHTGSGWEYFPLALAYAIPATGTYRAGFYFSSGGMTASTPALGRAFKSGDLTGAGQTGFATTTGGMMAVGVRSAPVGLTVVTAAQTADASRSNARVLLLYDPVDAVILDSDLIAEVTCDGGVHWMPASLSAVSDHAGGATQLCVAETPDTACTPGTSFAARITVVSGKTVELHGVALAVH